MFVNLYLTDGSNIRCCSIFPDEVKTGDMPYLSKDAIDKAISKVPWGNKFISYQSKTMSGRLHVNNIDYYEAV